MFIKTVLALSFTLGAMSGASATSCIASSHRYFIVCDVSTCKAAFSVHEVPGFGGCSRRPRVEDIDAQVGAYLGKLVTEVYSSEARGLYQLKLSSRYWGVPNPDKFDRLMEELQQTLPLTSKSEQCEPHKMSVAEIGGLLKQQTSTDSLSLVTEEFSPQAVGAKRAAVESEEKHEQLKNILLALAYWGTSTIALLAFIHSVYLFFSRLYDGRREGSSGLVGPVAIQLVLVALGVGAVLLYPIELWPGSLLVPAAVVILLCEGFSKLRTRRVS